MTNPRDYVTERLNTFLGRDELGVMIIRTPPRFGKTTMMMDIARRHAGAVEYRTRKKAQENLRREFSDASHITVGEGLFPNLTIYDDYQDFGMQITAPATIIIGSDWPRIIPHWTWEIINVPAIWGNQSTIPEMFSTEAMNDTRDKVSGSAWFDIWQGALR